MNMDKAEQALYGDKIGVQSQYYYVTTVWQGKSVLLGPYSTEEKANEVGFSGKLSGTFEIISLPTRDRGKATQMLRARKLNTGSNLGQALQRVRHKI
jgi:hypothetical protein